jgi:CheY-like chemotaxis protein
MTASTARLSASEVTELRHELRTPVNHIVGYAEMLLEDAEADGRTDRREMLAEVLSAASDVLGLISGALPTTSETVSPSEITALYESLRTPQARIVQAANQLLDIDGAARDEQYVGDVTKILRAAQRLVVVEDPEKAAGQEAKDESASSDPASAGHQETYRLLVVDDVADNRDILRRRLEREGYTVECAENGRQALEMVGARSFDLVLLDILMPEIDGYGVLEQLKHDPSTRDIPVIMISALDDMASVVRCIERGAEDHLPKPFDPVMLRARISATLEKKRLRDAELEYLNRVQEVIQAATAVEDGTYQSGSIAHLADHADELGRLVRVFDGMAKKVRERESLLKGRVRDLRREIEAARATPRAVDAMVDGGNLRTGQQFAERYEIEATVGSGGMGSVYRARDLELDEEVAIKTLKHQFVTDETLIGRFKQEIRLARRLSHGNVVRTHDFGQWRGVYYLTMEHVEGITVRELIDTRGQLEISSTLAIGSQLGAALDAAHEQGIIHRDIKPQNLLLDADGVLKVMDFGIARLAEKTSTLTEAGLVVGTPSYMSPEQLLSEAIDVRSDLFAVGVVLYECLTATLPFEAETPVALIVKILNEEPLAPRSLNGDIPEALSELILSLLAKNPDDRVQTAAELGDLLRGLN